MEIRAEEAVKRVLDLVPGSTRAIAERAGVSEKLLRLIRDGERTATPRVMESLTEALETMAHEYAEAAAILRTTLTETQEDAR